MKFFIYTDPHWSSYSSIVRSRGDKYSTRIMNLIQSINWVEDEASKHGCDCIVCLGDFFDKSECNAEELTALQEIKWAPVKHYMLVGNHEMSRSNLELSSLHLFNIIPECTVIDSPYMFNDDSDTSIMFLPYILEKDRKPLAEYFESMQCGTSRIIFSHNDIAGIQLGKVISSSGFSIEEIEENCNLFINGHLHNGQDIGDKIINVGNITGQNFSEDAYIYQHKALILDTAEKTVDTFINPYALNFYKVDLTPLQPIVDDIKIQNLLNELKAPAVASIKINSELEGTVRDLLSTCTNIIEVRLTIINSHSNISDADIIENSKLDHIQKFQSYVLENIGNDMLTINELERIST